MTDSLAITLNALGTQLVFDHVPLVFREGEFQNVFAKKNNKTVDETLSGRKYAFLRPEVEKTYPSRMDMEIGAFVLFLKESGDLLYQKWFSRILRGEHRFCAKIGNVWSVITHICCFLAVISLIFRFTTRNPKEPELFYAIPSPKTRVWRAFEV